MLSAPALISSFHGAMSAVMSLTWPAVYSAARSFQRLSPGSLFWMWYQVMVTGSPPAAADSLAAVVGAAVAAVDGAVVAAPFEHAPTTSIAVAASAAIRPRDIDMCPRSSCSESC